MSLNSLFWMTALAIPAGFRLEQSCSLGLKLVHTLTRQLGGTVIPSPPKKGSAVRIRFSPKGAAAYV